MYLLRCFWCGCLAFRYIWLEVTGSLSTPQSPPVILRDRNSDQIRIVNFSAANYSGKRDVSVSIIIKTKELLCKKITNNFQSLEFSVYFCTVASWSLTRLSPHRAVWVRALEIVMCSFRPFTLRAPLSTQCINGYRRILCWGLPCDGLTSQPGGVEILLALSCYG